MSIDLLDVHLSSTLIGRLERSARGISFVYVPDLVGDPRTTPLSLSIPADVPTHGPAVVEPWLANLLSDHPQVRRRLAQKFGVSTSSLWDLLTALGEDLPGAVQVFPEGQLPVDAGDLIPWSASRIAEAIRGLHTDEAWVDPDPARGHWSLAGAQGKFALARTADGWAEPRGAHPSTHIFKVGVHGLDLSDVAEFVTMRAATHLGLSVATCSLTRFDEELALVVERYDRVSSADEVIRLHQEDFCQILGVFPEAKYQADGGPSWRDCAGAVRTHFSAQFAEQAALEVMRWQVFNMLSAGTDGHAKNLSVLLDADHRVLAPAYDLVSLALLSDPREVEHRSRLAMSFGGEFDVRFWTEKRLSRAADEGGLPVEAVVDEVVRQSDAIDGAFSSALEEAEEAFAGSRTDLSVMRERWAARSSHIARNHP